MTEREKIQHLLRRFGFGASELELEVYEPLGLEGTIRRLLETANTPDNWDVDPMEFANRQGVVNIRVAQGIYHLRLLVTERPLVEKMTIFWHNHFAVSAEKVTNAMVMLNHLDTLRSGCLGSFRDLLTAVSRDPAMIYWLDNQLNVKSSPNENFGRELMELFTLGIGHYSEKDVAETARAFTGWTYGGVQITGPAEPPRRVQRFRFDRTQHDGGSKTILGKTGNFDGDDVISFLCEHPQTSRYISWKAWRFFAHEDPSPSVVEKMSQAFRESGLQISALVKAIMSADEFYSPSVVRQQVKNPIDVVVPTARQLGAGGVARQRLAAGRANPRINEQTGLNVGMIQALSTPFAMLQSAKSMGMELMYPPDVSGWVTGKEWISTATMISRMKWGGQLIAGGTPMSRANIGGDVGGNRGPTVGIFAWPLISENPTPSGIVDRMASIFDVNLSASAKAGLIKAAGLSGSITASTANDATRAVTEALLLSPDFQMN